MYRPLLGLALILCCIAISVSAESPASVEGGQSEIKITTYNIRYANPRDGEDVWPNRKKDVASFSKRSDIIGMQEVTEPQFAYLRDQMPSFGSYGVGRDDGKSGGEHAPIFYSKSRFDVIDKGTFWLSETPDKIGKKGWDAALPRTCTWIHLKDHKGGKEIYVANTHFDHRGAQARAESGKLLADRLGKLPKDLPIVLMGDFNCLRDSEPYNAITSAFSDARDVTKTKPTGPSSTWNGFREIAPDRIIDHVFVRSVTVSRLAVQNPKTSEGRFASDHLPVEAIVQPGN